VLLGGGGAHRLRAELRLLPGAASAIRDRDGCRVGCGRVAGDGEGPGQVPGRRVRFAAAGLRPGVPAGSSVLSPRVPPLGLATALLHRGASRAAGAVGTGARQGIRGVARDAAREVEGFGADGPRDTEAVSVPAR